MKYRVKSKSRDIYHIVEEDENGRMTCQCEFFQFKGYQDVMGTCSHIKKIRKYLNDINKRGKNPY